MLQPYVMPPPLLCAPRRVRVRRARRRRVGKRLGCHGTGCVRHARGWYAYGVRAVVARKGKLPCAFGTCSTREAGTRSPYVQYGGPGTWAWKYMYV